MAKILDKIMEVQDDHSERLKVHHTAIYGDPLNEHQPGLVQINKKIMEILGKHEEKLENHDRLAWKNNVVRGLLWTCAVVVGGAIIEFIKWFLTQKG